MPSRRVDLTPESHSAPGTRHPAPGRADARTRRVLFFLALAAASAFSFAQEAPLPIVQRQSSPGPIVGPDCNELVIPDAPEPIRAPVLIVEEPIPQPEPRRRVIEAEPFEPVPIPAGEVALTPSESVAFLQAAARDGRYEDFAAALAVARRRVSSLPASSDRRAMADAVGIYADLEEIWKYSVTDPIGAFYNDATLSGAFSRLAREYPGYVAFIAPFEVTDDRGTRFYPTGETRQFLADRAERALRGVRLPAAPTDVIASRGTRPAPEVRQPAGAQPPRVAEGRPAVRPPRTESSRPATRPRPATTTPSQRRAATTTPSQPRAATTTPSQPRAATTTPSQPRAATTTPSQPRAATTTPAQPRAATTTPAQPRRATPRPTPPRPRPAPVVLPEDEPLFPEPTDATPSATTPPVTATEGATGTGPEPVAEPPNVLSPTTQPAVTPAPPQPTADRRPPVAETRRGISTNTLMLIAFALIALAAIALMVRALRRREPPARIITREPEPREETPGNVDWIDPETRHWIDDVNKQDKPPN